MSVHASSSALKAAVASAATALVLAVGAPGVAGQAPGPSANLSVEKSDDADPVISGAELTYTVEIRNLGPDPATDVAMTDNLPGPVDRVSVTPSAGTCNDKDKIVCDIPSLDPDAVATVTIVVTVKKKSGTITNSASVQSSVPDPQPANNLATETTQVQNAPQFPGAPTCEGREPTILGTEGDDSITGTEKRDVIVALGGNDVIFGLGGNDVICGLPGDDTVRASAGIDTVRGASGNDVLKGGNSNDSVGGGLGRDRLGGGLGVDTLNGGPGRDRCNGGPAPDVKRSC
jgi:uncharacterized repeat protein (TIGR01451 family)